LIGRQICVPWLVAPLALSGAGCGQTANERPDTGAAGSRQPGSGGSSAASAGAGNASQGGAAGTSPDGNGSAGRDASAGSALTGGNASNGGANNSSGGTSDSSGGASNSSRGGAGGQGDGGACASGAQRCVGDGRETCENSAWRPAPCPLDQPRCEDGACVLRGPPMVKVGNFYIDSTEVTVGQYAAFVVDTDFEVPPQAPLCSWNWKYYPADFSFPPADPDKPMVEVDWCDAASYCQWAGKHLCGNIDRSARLAQKDFADPRQSQWFLACGGPQGLDHPSLSGGCNDSASATRRAGTTSCEGSVPGVFDLEGNVAEWIDTCLDTNDGQFNLCYPVGGGFPDQASCRTFPNGSARSTQRDWIGFRCCSG